MPTVKFIREHIHDGEIYAPGDEAEFDSHTVASMSAAGAIVPQKLHTKPDPPKPAPTSQNVSTAATKPVNPPNK